MFTVHPSRLRVDSANPTEFGRCQPREPCFTQDMSRRSIFDPFLGSEMRDDDLDYYNSETPLGFLPPHIGEQWSAQDPSSFDGDSVGTSVPSRNTLSLQNVTRTGSSVVRLASWCIRFPRPDLNSRSLRDPIHQHRFPPPI